MHRVDWLRDIRGIDYFDRLSLMIREWAELGMVLPIEAQPTSLPVPDLRVEQGRVVGNQPNDVRTDKKYQLTEEVEALFGPSAAARTSRAVGMTAGPPPKRIYRPGTI